MVNISEVVCHTGPTHPHLLTDRGGNPQENKQTKTALHIPFPSKEDVLIEKSFFFFVNSSLALPFFLHKSVILYNSWTSFLSARWDGSLNKANQIFKFIQLTCSLTNGFYIFRYKSLFRCIICKSFAPICGLSFHFIDGML